MKINWLISAALALFLVPTGDARALERLEIEDKVALERVYEIVVPGGHSVVLAFENNQFIQSLWLDDPSILTIATDRQLCVGGGGSDQCGFAQFIRLTTVDRASPRNAALVELNGPSFSSGGGESTLLTVITTDGTGQNRQVYQFTVVTTFTQSSNVSMFEIVPSRDGLLIAAIKNGATIAIASGEADTEAIAWQKLQTFIYLVEERGYSINLAIRESGVSIRLLNHLQKTGSNSRYNFSPVISLETAP